MELWQWLKKEETLHIDDSLKTPGGEGGKVAIPVKGHKISKGLFF